MYSSGLNELLRVSALLTKMHKNSNETTNMAGEEGG